MPARKASISTLEDGKMGDIALMLGVRLVLGLRDSQMDT